MSGNPHPDLDDEDEDDEWDDDEDHYYEDDIYDRDDGESPGETMARLAAEIEAGRATAPPGWKLDRPSPGVLVWTIPAGCRYAYTLTGDPLPLPLTDRPDTLAGTDSQTAARSYPGQDGGQQGTHPAG